MRKCYAESPKGDFIYGWVVDVVCAVQPDDRSDGCPCAKGTGAERCDLGRRGAGIDLLRARERKVCLDAVAERHY